VTAAGIVVTGTAQVTNLVAAGFTMTATSGEFIVPGDASFGNVGVHGNVETGGEIAGVTLVALQGISTQGPVVAAGAELTGSAAPSLVCQSSSVSSPVAQFTHMTENQTGWSGVCSQVGAPTRGGFVTDGRYISLSGSAAQTHLETADGHRVVTSPLVLQHEVQLSGSAQLSGGRAVVALDADAPALIAHTGEQPYRVLLTPTGRCGVLAVVEKSNGGFVVEEQSGAGDATFDWLVIARQAESADSTIGAELPIALLPMPDPPAPEAAPPSALAATKTPETPPRT
jgi:hypothetical protein